MTKVLITGAAGRMGKTLIRCAQKIDDIQLTGAVEHTGHPDLGKDAGALAGIKETGIILGSDLRAAITGTDVMIDFTFHTAVPGNAETAVDLGVAMVIGTTGLDDDETSAVKQAAKKVPIVWAPNMSLGVNLLFSAAKRAASVLGAGYSVEIDETHHVHKKDAPSGTALRLGEKVADGLGRNFSEIMVHDPEGKNNRHDKDRIIIRSHREGEIVGDHTVSFQNEGERIELSHHAESRGAFAMGALRAAQWVTGRKPGLYDMQDVLGMGNGWGMNDGRWVMGNG